jgi:hypothetical protein
VRAIWTLLKLILSLAVAAVLGIVAWGLLEGPCGPPLFAHPSANAAPYPASCSWRGYLLFAVWAVLLIAAIWLPLRRKKGH